MPEGCISDAMRMASDAMRVAKVVGVDRTAKEGLDVWAHYFSSHFDNSHRDSFLGFESSKQASRRINLTPSESFAVDSDQIIDTPAAGPRYHCDCADGRSLVPTHHAYYDNSLAVNSSYCTRGCKVAGPKLG